MVIVLRVPVGPERFDRRQVARREEIVQIGEPSNIMVSVTRKQAKELLGFKSEWSPENTNLKEDWSHEKEVYRRGKDRRDSNGDTPERCKR